MLILYIIDFLHLNILSISFTQVNLRSNYYRKHAKGNVFNFGHQRITAQLKKY